MTREYKVVSGNQLRDLCRSPFPGFQLAPTQSTLHPPGTRVRILIYLSLHLYSSAYHYGVLRYAIPSVVRWGKGPRPPYRYLSIRTCFFLTPAFYPTY